MQISRPMVTYALMRNTPNNAALNEYALINKEANTLREM